MEGNKLILMIQWSKREGNAIVLNDYPQDLFSEEFIDDYLQKVYNEQITDRDLDLKYHKTVGGELYEGAAFGFGGHVDTWPDVTKLGECIEGIRDNCYIFSAAKQYQQVREMSDFILDNGVKSSWADFKKKAHTVFDEYNVNYLKTEYNTAVGQAQMARDWVQFELESDLFPFLTYQTQHDQRVRDAHAMINGVTRPVKDSFWTYYMPKNGWNCRCFVTSHQHATVTKIPKGIPRWGSPEFPEVFKMNPGKDKMIFKKDHPYFEVAKGDKGFKKKNFGLPIP